MSRLAAGIRGMTLLEVMVALLIFALTGSAVLKAASEHLRGVGQIEEITFATWVANNRLNELLLTRPWPVKNNQKGEEEMAGRKWYWKQVVRPTNDTNLKAVEISVGLNPNNTNSITTVITYMAKPLESS